MAKVITTVIPEATALDSNSSRILGHDFLNSPRPMTAESRTTAQGIINNPKNENNRLRVSLRIEFEKYRIHELPSSRKVKCIVHRVKSGEKDRVQATGIEDGPSEPAPPARRDEVDAGR